MSQQDKSTLKGYFQTGNVPNQSQFEDLIDSYLNKTDDSDQIVPAPSAGDAKKIPRIKDDESGLELDNYTWVDVRWFGAEDGTDSSTAIQNAIDSISKGVVVIPEGTYSAKNITPKNDVSLWAMNATLKAIDDSIISYNSDNQLVNFNMIGIEFDGNAVAADIASIDQPNPSVPTKTWANSVIDNCTFKNSGAIGLYCPIPGSVTIRDSHFDGNDIGLAWDREHFYIKDTLIENNRIGIRSTANHATFKNLILAHNTENGWTVSGAGLGTYTDVRECAFIGCVAIDNPIGFEGTFTRCRFNDCRIIDNQIGLAKLDSCLIIGSQFGKNSSWAIDDLDTETIVLGCLFKTDGVIGGSGIRTVAGGNSYQIAYNRFSALEYAIYQRAGLRNSVGHNNIRNCDWGIYSPDFRENNQIEDNKINDTTNVGIYISSTVSQVDDFDLNNNIVRRSGQENILIENIPTTFGSSISGNKTTDANEDNLSHSSISVSANMIACLVKDNINRNTATGNADFAMEFTTASGSDTIFDGNVARNMQAANDFKRPAGFTDGTNIGTITAS